MPTTPDNDDLLVRLRETYSRRIDAGFEFVFKGVQPGTTEFMGEHLIGSSAPEPIIERMGPVGAEGFGPVELIDGRTGQSIARVNRHLRRRLEG